MNSTIGMICLAVENCIKHISTDFSCFQTTISFGGTNLREFRANFGLKIEIDGKHSFQAQLQFP